MKIREYQELASKTMQREMSDVELLANIMLGLAGETGELADYIKKGVFHKHGIEKMVLLEEIGDALWYLSSLASYFDIDLEEAAQRNIDKLKERYPGGFTVKDSLERRDKNE